MTNRDLPSFPRPSRAMVVGASGGIGAALSARIAAAGLEVVALSRRSLGATTGRMTRDTLDLTDEATIAAACTRAANPDAPPLRLVIVATGRLHGTDLMPEKSLKSLDAARLATSFAINTIGPALVAKHALPLLPREGRSVFAVLSARVGSIGDNRLGGWHGYRASKAALNQMVRTIAVEMARTRPEAVLVALHPGTVVTGLSAPFRGGVSAERLFTPDEAAGHLLQVINGVSPGDSGGFYAWDGSSIPF